MPKQPNGTPGKKPRAALAQVRRIETLTDASMAMRRDLAHHHRLFDLICAERSA
jgi:hypothetical protein